MLKHGEPNPLNVFGLRKLDHCPPHFERVVFDIKTSEKQITDWIYENLSGRFYLGDAVVTNPDSGLPALQKVAAFERHEEASYFGLFLPNINVHEYNVW